MELYIIRHAESENNALWAATLGDSDGRLPDPLITETGHRQAELLAEYLATGDPDLEPNYYARRHNRGGFGLTYLYTSLMLRAIATANYVSERTGLPLHAWPEIHERGGLHDTHPETGEKVGVDGPNRDHFVRHFPALSLPDEIGELGWWNRPPESVDESYPRAQRVWATLFERHGNTDDRVAMVTHGGFFQSLLETLLVTDETSTLRPAALSKVWFGLSNTGICRISFEDEYTAIRYLNRVDHLPSDLITG